MMLSKQLEDKKLNIAIIDSNQSFAQKVKIAGGGKCNFTNTNLSSKNFSGDEKFINYVLKHYSKDDFLKFLSDQKIEIRKGKYYFFKNSSNQLISKLKSKNTTYIFNEKVLDIEKVDDIFNIKTSKHTYQAKKLIVASGGESFKNIGASSLALDIAKKFDIQTTPFTPALVPLSLQPDQFWMKKLSGISFNVEISVEGKVLDEDMLFTHKSLSGPVILSTSLYWKKGSISINFIPNQNIDKDILKSNKKISSYLNIPKRFAKEFLEHIDLNDKTCSSLKVDELEKLKTINFYSFAPAGNLGFSKAEVSRGGVDTSEIDETTMMSKKVKNLYFLGEALDVTGELGGYNIQWAISSSYVCSKSIC